MRVPTVVLWLVAVGMLTSWSPRAALGQLALATRTPRFFYASSTVAKPVEIDVSRHAVLAKVVSLHAEHATVGGLLAEIQRQSGLTFAYDPHFPATRPLTLEADSITVAAALGAVLVGIGVDVVLTPTSHVWLIEAKLATAQRQEGTILGAITDKATGAPIGAATVILAPTGRSTTTGTDGRYRFDSVSPGDYTVRARYIGYEPLIARLAVREDEEVIVDLQLQKSPHRLEEVVTTGTMVPTEVKAIPTPVTVITERDIAQQHPHTVQVLFRQAVPTAVAWDNPIVPSLTSFSSRGASTFGVAGSQMKVFVDGIEAAFPTNAPIDPNSIARIEVIRGPQAAAIYGSDAMGGVIQIFTKRGDPSLRRPEIDAEGALGVVQTPYAGYGGVIRQNYAASVRGGGSDVGYNFGAGYSHTDDYLPNGEISRQSIPSVYGGMRFARGMVTADVSGRYYTHNVPNVFNPELFQTGSLFFSKPNYLVTQVQNQTVGARIRVAPTSWWEHTVTVGIDRTIQDLHQAQPRLTTPADTLLQVINQTFAKTSIGYNTSLRSSLNASISGSLTLGFDHYSLPSSTYNTAGALNTTGTILTAAGLPFAVNRSTTNNTGYYAQIQVGLRDELFFTGGLRAEQNTNFGDDADTPVSPRVGLSWAPQVGRATLKVRGSYGRAIQAPSPNQKFAFIQPGSVTLANARLGPQRQQGWDAGVDAVFGRRGSLSVTYFDQRAEDLIQLVDVQLVPVRTNQWQNVGRVKNTGIEIEAALYVSSTELRAQYGYARSRIEQLAPGYTGDLRVGEQSWLTPKHTAGASLAVTPFRGTALAAGLTYVGNWSYYDILALNRCFGGTGPCQTGPGLRNYRIDYPGFVKVTATVSQEIGRSVSGFVSIDNLTDNEKYELFNFNPVMGRITTVGLRLHY